MKGRHFIDQLGEHQLLKKDTVLHGWSSLHVLGASTLKLNTDFFFS
jgi:hypothetical protein